MLVQGRRSYSPEEYLVVTKWIFSEYDGEAATLKLASVPFAIVLADIYDKVDFGAE